MKIGLHQDSGLIYESQSTRGHPLWPAPLIFQTVIASESDDEFKAAKQGRFEALSFMFREDTYNSSSRVRKGRLYKSGEALIHTWQVYPHPALNENFDGSIYADHNGKFINKALCTYSSFRLRSYLKREGIDKPIFLIGCEDSFTIWSLVNIETTATGDELIIIRARKSIGALPNLYKEKILKADGKSVVDYVDKLEEDLYRAGPESIVDRSREAATAILSKYLQSEGLAANGKDLNDLADLCLKKKLEIVTNSAKTIARLHARGKHAEQEKRSPRRITEQDAETAVQLVGLILCDIDWGEW